MSDKNHKRAAWRDIEKQNEELDHQLNAALANYASIEPRPGLEERILANLRTEREGAVARAWWRWSVATAMAATFILGVALTWRLARPAQVVVQHHPSTSTQGSPHSGTQLAARGDDGVRPSNPGPMRTAMPHRSHPAAVMERPPRLDQFPSPRPLSEQEQILADYVAGDRTQAVLVARARMAALKQDLAEEIAEASADTNHDYGQPASQRADE